jgi:hypothetical protein
VRILGFSKKWPKLEQKEFTTFRLPRRDRDWEEGEQAQIVYRPRSKDREPLGVASITRKETRRFFKGQPGDKELTHREAIADGFISTGDMMLWMVKAHGERVHNEPLNKLTLKWLKDKDEGR